MNIRHSKENLRDKSGIGNLWGLNGEAVFCEKQ